MVLATGPTELGKADKTPTAARCGSPPPLGESRERAAVYGAALRQAKSAAALMTVMTIP